MPETENQDSNPVPKQYKDYNAFTNRELTMEDMAKYPGVYDFFSDNGITAEDIRKNDKSKLQSFGFKDAGRNTWKPLLGTAGALIGTAIMLGVMLGPALPFVLVLIAALGLAYTTYKGTKAYKEKAEFRRKFKQHLEDKGIIQNEPSKAPEITQPEPDKAPSVVPQQPQPSLQQNPAPQQSVPVEPNLSSQPKIVPPAPLPKTPIVDFTKPSQGASTTVVFPGDGKQPVETSSVPHKDFTQNSPVTPETVVFKDGQPQKVSNPNPGKISQPKTIVVSEVVKKSSGGHVPTSTPIVTTPKVPGKGEKDETPSRE